ncbi:MAG: lipoate--protein ligase family protein [Planctomycetes bacterium]|nr:lipoate--protein ligase family protein [Planctomycetota bacterium]MCH9728031.1 lipoate--protein ligase family protein [Planctomycetota bacterium]MCH9775833.1 lipoate--protein ligase family protein [Planctomycetota bacterium]MCH9791095.1 lipoate--protein ligase family protein [Planctomycetota bacterium]MDF1746997.1 biotin/lipoate A/B protein ligase family protein [Gimesia sp.]
MTHSSIPDHCRLIIEPAPLTGSWNMAVDEALLESAVSQDICTLRWYRWKEPTISLGYFQSNETEVQNDTWKDLPRVRRLSGGGAILHHYELTYSFAIPACHPLSRSLPDLYLIIHQPLIDALSKQGLNVEFRGTSVTSQTEPFLCFGRGDERDLVYQGKKILGSAQRRRRGSVVQHGSLLLLTSDYAPHFPGLLNQTGKTSLYQDNFLETLTEEFSKAISQTIDLPLQSRNLTDDEFAQATELENEKYSLPAWTSRK